MQITGLSINGVLLFATSFLVVASGFASLRPDVFGLLLHPFLVPVALAFPFVIMSRLGDFPVRILVTLLIATGIYWFSIFSGGNFPPGEVFKTGSAIVTIITCALLVRRRGDVVAGVLGLNLAIAFLAVNGLQDTGVTGVDAMEAANKNSYSLFALPAILLSGYVCLRMPGVSIVIKAVLIACSLAALAAIFMSANRSGYVGAVLVGLMLFWDRRGQGLLLVGAVTGLLLFGLARFGSTEVFEQRMEDTVSGHESDDLRKAILWACLDIGLENPIIGISPQKLPSEIGQRVGVQHRKTYIDSHNVFAHVFASSGVLCILALGAAAGTMWFWKPRNGVKVGRRDDPLRDARALLRMMVMLWIVRGMFTREILYNPSFNIAIGLGIGLCLLAEVARESMPQFAAKRPMPVLPAVGAAPTSGV